MINTFVSTLVFLLLFTWMNFVMRNLRPNIQRLHNIQRLARKIFSSPNLERRDKAGERNVFLKLGAGAFPVENHDSGAQAGVRRAAIERTILDLVCPRPPRPRPAALRTTRRSRTAGARRRLSPRATSRSAARGGRGAPAGRGGVP